MTKPFKRSNDPEFAEKVEDMVDLYIDPPAHAVVVSIDEKSQIQALIAPSLACRLKPGKSGDDPQLQAQRHDDVIRRAQCSRRNHDQALHAKSITHKEFIKFLNAVERTVPAGKVVHATADNYATTQTSKSHEMAQPSKI